MGALQSESNEVSSRVSVSKQIRSYLRSFHVCTCNFVCWCFVARTIHTMWSMKGSRERFNFFCRRTCQWHSQLSSTTTAATATTTHCSPSRPPSSPLYHHYTIRGHYHHHTIRRLPPPPQHNYREAFNFLCRSFHPPRHDIPWHILCTVHLAHIIVLRG